MSEAWRVILGTGEVRDMSLARSHMVGAPWVPNDDGLCGAADPRIAVTAYAGARAWPVREILAPGEFSAEEMVVAAIRSYGSVLTETRGSLAEACDAAAVAERSRIRAACDAIRDRALVEAEREVRQLDAGLGPLDIRDSAALRLAGTQHYALACGAIECADAIGRGVTP